jgi:outer membrane protein OmpA-like peptidoglycan-associated protein
MDPGAQSADEPHGGASPGHTMSKVTERKLARHPAGSRLGWSFVLVPALVAAGAGFLGGPGVERDLEAQGQSALQAAKIRKVELQADGVFVTAKVPTSVDADRVRVLLTEVDGVAAVTVEQVFASKREERACTNLEAKLNRATRQQRVPFVGRTDRLTPAGVTMVRQAGRLVAACGSAVVYVGGHTDEATSNGPTLTLRRAQAMIRVMRKAGAPADRLVPRGYGAQYEIDKSGTPAARAKNERGSITVEGQ